MSESTETVHSVARALSILEALSLVDEMGITELSRELDLGKATIYRLITTLRIHGYVEQAASSKYKLTFKLFEMGNKVVNRLGVRTIAYPYMEQLAIATNETINLAILEHIDVVYIERIESREPLRMGLDVGLRIPAYCTALGRAMLAYRNPAEVDSFLIQAEREGKIVKYTDNTVTNLKLLKNQLAEIREQGYSFDDEYYLSGIRGVAAPIFNYSGQMIAAISIAGPTVRVTSEVVSELIPIVKEAAKNISIRLGYDKGDRH